MKIARVATVLAFVVTLFVALDAAPASAATYTVTTTADSGIGSLRQAITDADAAGGASTISFAIDGAGVHQIVLSSGLPTVTVPLTIDGRTQPGYTDHPLIELEGATTFDLLSFGAGAGGSDVAGLALKRYSTALSAAEQITVEDNYIGLHGDGTADVGENALTGSNATGGTGAILSGPHSVIRRNVVSQNGNIGMSVCGDDALVVDNLVGTDPSGLLPRANRLGIAVGFCNPTATPMGVSIGALGHGNVLGASGEVELLDVGNSSTIAYNSIGVGSDGHTLLQSIIGVNVAAPGHGGHVANNVFVSGAVVSLGVGATDVEVDHNRFGTTSSGDSSPFSGWGMQVGADRVSIHDNDFSRLRNDAIVVGPIDGETVAQSNDLGITFNAIHDNGGHGIVVRNGSTGSILANNVHDNGGAGIAITGVSADFKITGNVVDNNGGLAIDLGDDGPTPNDAGDVDTGPDGLQNWPVITSVTPHPDSVTVAGVIDTKPATRVDIDVSQLAACDPSGFGEIGPRHGGTTVTTNGSGHANFSMTLPTTDFDGTWWSAIATTSDGTSEAGACVRSPGAQLIAYVTRVYEQLLGREPDPSGLRYWYGLLVGGLPRFTFVNALEHLPEFAGLFVDQQYLTILDRPAEPAGREYWSEYIQHGGTADDLRSLLYGSSEYAATHDAGTNSAYVDALYHDILGRSPDSSGLAYWTDLLNRGVSRVTVARAMLSLPEPIAVAIGRLYQTYLGRPATAADQTYWSDVWRQYGELTVLAMIVSSDEYYASTPF